MTKKIIVIMLASLSLFLTGCAAIMTSNTQKVLFTSYPSGADVYVDGVYVGATPAIVHLQRPRTFNARGTVPTPNVSIRKHGFREQNRILIPNRSRWVWGNLFNAAALSGLTEIIIAGADTPKTEEGRVNRGIGRIYGHGISSIVLGWGLSNDIRKNNISSYPNTHFNLTPNISLVEFTAIREAVERGVAESFRGIQSNSRVAIALVEVHGDREMRSIFEGFLESGIRRMDMRLADRTDTQRIYDEVQDSDMTFEQFERQALASGRYSMVDYILTARAEGRGLGRVMRIRVIEVGTGNLVNTSFANIPDS
jgi:hypothetical protein